MCYRFHADGHGEVIAEETELSDRYLGLHYPASDIPEPARKQFLLNRIRIIADVDAPISQLVPSAALDLSYSKLRAVSPIHLTYLRNMGVAATLVLPLVVDDTLWGLMVCHHSTPKLLSATELHSAELSSQVLELLLENILRAERDRQIIRTQELAYSFAHTETPTFELQDMAAKLAHHFAVDALAAFIDGVWHSLDNWTGDEVDLSMLHQKTHDDVFITDDISAVVGQNMGDDLVGCAFLSLDAQRNDYLVLGRKRFNNVVSWAGAPKKAVGFDKDGLPILEPRASFSRWEQTVASKSKPFSQTDHLALSVVLPSLRALLASKKAQRLADTASLMERAQTDLRNQLLNTARSASLGELAAAIAHELNQPLTSISNYVSASQLLLKNPDEDQKNSVIELMESAVTEAQRAGQIVHHLRNLMKPGFERKLEFDGNDMLEQAVRLALTSSRQGGVHLDLHLSPDAPSVYADKVQIEQVVFNLVRNAVEAMEGMEERRLAVTSKITDDENFEVSIEDTGAGIDPNILPYLFEPFRTSKSDGMGIGLSLCRSTIEDHHGRIWAAEIGDGTRFTFAIPLGQTEGGNEH
ncbi:GAF domain-containing protein [Sulfitobacter sp. TSTF-M16]|uniref:histidine kinase n=2 Tax=Sulfitobacter aestuariivivens TaxID=2766981 RepID=A0A927D289_9RHOB|nr:GAF domain-containing protein [Sulfitobacter aestuariivivens]